MVANLRHMEVFRAVYYARSITGAARALSISQPSVTRMMHRLEDGLGYKLFRLSKGRIVPTSEADQLIAEIDVVFSAVTRVREVATHLRDGALDRLAVVAGTSMAIGILPGVLKALRDRHPKLSIFLNALNLVDQISAISRMDADIGFAINVPGIPGFERRLMGRANFVAVVHREHPLSEKQVIMLEDFSRWPSVVAPAGGPIGNIIYPEFQRIGIEPIVEATTKSPISSGALIRAFRGIGILDDMTARLVADEALLIKPLDRHLDFPVHGFWREMSSLSQAQIALLEHVTEAFELADCASDLRQNSESSGAGAR